MSTEFARIGAAALRERLREGGEIALLDVREEGVFAARHLLAASNAPISRLERIVPALVPRKATPIVLVDDDERLAERAAKVLAAAGYGDISILDGGVPAWAAAGFELFAGVYVPSKAFAEVVEVTNHTPHIDAHELEARRAAGDKVVLLDSRPFDEYNWITIPGSIDCPSGELVLRARQSVPDDDTLVVVNCGGRTRSIIGAQILIDAGLPNKVVSLKNGTQGWHLAGLDVQRGATRVAPLPSAPAHDWARQAAGRLADRFGAPTIDAETLARYEAEQDADHALPLRRARSGRIPRRPSRRLPLARRAGSSCRRPTPSSPSRSARIVLADSDGVRAHTTAAWLRRMGFDHVVVLDENAPATLETRRGAGDRHRPRCGRGREREPGRARRARRAQRGGRGGCRPPAASTAPAISPAPGSPFAAGSPRMRPSSRPRRSMC